VTFTAPTSGAAVRRKGIPPKENGMPRIPSPGPDGRTSKVK